MKKSKGKVFVFLLCVLVSLFIGCMSADSNYKLEHLKEDQLASQIIEKLGEQLSKKYQMRIVGDSAQMPEGVINNLGLHFHVLRVLEKKEIREILVGCVEAFLTEVNSDKEIRPYLKSYPFTSKNISIVLGVYDAKGGKLYDPIISSAFASHGKLWYGTKDKGKKFGYKSESEESFEEAVKLIEKSKENQ